MQRYRFICITMLILLIAGLSPFSLSAKAAEADSSSKINEILQMIHTNHLSDASEEDLIEAAIQGMVDSLDDPYTEYFSKDELADYLKAVEGGYLGIGITMAHDENGVYIADVAKASPASQIGLLKGDYIQRINEKKLTFNNSDIVFEEALSGSVEGSKITLSIKRGNEIKSFTIPLKTMDIPTVTAKMLPEGVGYLALSGFTADADKAFTAALNELKSQRMKSLIIDLRYNGGGYIETAKAIAAHFIKDQLLMTIRNKDGLEKPIMVSGGTKADYPIVILVNEYSASASEVFAGAMQDYKLAEIVGVNTYGKGVTQNIMPVYNGGALKITTEEYFTPKDNPVNHIGIKPDHEVKGDVAQMIKAYYAAGAKKVQLKLTKTDYTLNQIQFAGYGVEAYIEKNKDIFVPTRLIMAIADGVVGWDNESKLMVLTNGKVTTMLATNSVNILMRDGISYVSASYIHSKFPEISWTFINKTVILEASH
ncbi:S41 family peptidase [Paenibacillus psychroresistens]|uniref:S41 family peptidase n=1 Tax=Paenibacillus psychroresistens TaxID=1778678 RepID=A0A6B8RJP4_9BACL|nr:S41 family peptidase [Paenibacillus psychroresistens]QGQ95626.1 S41 family peptidase [Paenibacillus psychroresistens]